MVRPTPKKAAKRGKQTIKDGVLKDWKQKVVPKPLNLKNKTNRPHLDEDSLPQRDNTYGGISSDDEETTEIEREGTIRFTHSDVQITHISENKVLLKSPKKNGRNGTKLALSDITQKDLPPGTEGIFTSRLCLEFLEYMGSLPAWSMPNDGFCRDLWNKYFQDVHYIDNFDDDIFRIAKQLMRNHWSNTWLSFAAKCSLNDVLPEYIKKEDLRSAEAVSKRMKALLGNTFDTFQKDNRLQKYVFIHQRPFMYASSNIGDFEAKWGYGKGWLVSRLFGEYLKRVGITEQSYTKDEKPPRAVGALSLCILAIERAIRLYGKDGTMPTTNSKDKASHFSADRYGKMERGYPDSSGFVIIDRPKVLKERIMQLSDAEYLAIVKSAWAAKPNDGSTRASNKAELKSADVDEHVNWLEDPEPEETQSAQISLAADNN